jgi:microsomal dipeptidase-like Zn-dependent dipeptidase
MIQSPVGVKIYDTPTSTFWFDDNGIICAIIKNNPTQTLEDTVENIEGFKKVIGSKKVCMMIDVTYSPESTKETRDYVSVEFPKFVKAIAMISESALGTMLANLFFTIKKQPYPTKMFNKENEAKEWLKQYL